MSLKFAFAGFRHPHVFALYERVKNTPGTEIAAACEPDPAARAAAERRGVAFTHTGYEDLWKNSAAFDAVAIGDAYGNRGKIVLEALSRGKHVLSDKPFCISGSELDSIEKLLRKTGLKLGCMFDLRTAPNMRTAKRLVRSGAVGIVQGIQFNGMHPLNYGVRPDWYFQPGMHGGTINDIAIHAFDFLPELTGLEIKRILAAHTGNAAFPEHPEFRNSAQLMFELENGVCANGDVSYFAPAGTGFTLPAYWRFTVAGTGGLIEFNYADSGVFLARPGMEKPETVPPDPGEAPDYFDGFLAEIAGTPSCLTTEHNLRTARFALEAERTAAAKKS